MGWHDRKSKLIINMMDMNTCVSILYIWKVLYRHRKGASIIEE